MASPSTLPELLESLTQSLASAQEITPKISSIDRPKDGISLLDVKNELLLSYLQNLVFLILLKIRNSRDGGDEGTKELDESVRSKLVELRLFLEKGARPLEDKLRFSIERFLSRARDSQNDINHKSKTSNSKSKTGSETDTDSASDAESSSEEDGEDNDEDQDSVDDMGNEAPKIKSRPVKSTGAPKLGGLADDATVRTAHRSEGTDSAPNGVYRPPRRERHTMETSGSRRDKSQNRRPQKSHTMDEFVASELSGAPMAEPSVGTTIVQGGRKMKTAGERQTEAERQTYEETNYTRLPKESKKDKAKKNKQSGRSGRMEFGGEEWHNLGEGVDRIDRLTKRKDGGRGGNVRAMLEKSRKRGPETVDGPRGSGEMGERFQKRLKVLETGRRDRGKKR